MTPAIEPSSMPVGACASVRFSAQDQSFGNLPARAPPMAPQKPNVHTAQKSVQLRAGRGVSLHGLIRFCPKPMMIGSRQVEVSMCFR